MKKRKLFFSLEYYYTLSILPLTFSLCQIHSRSPMHSEIPSLHETPSSSPKNSLSSEPKSPSKKEQKWKISDSLMTRKRSPLIRPRSSDSYSGPSSWRRWIKVGYNYVISKVSNSLFWKQVSAFFIGISISKSSLIFQPVFDSFFSRRSGT